MDELNLASRFGPDDEEDQRPNRRKKKPRFRTGVGMEKPVEAVDEVEDDIGGIEMEPGEERSPAEMPPMGDLGEDIGPMLPDEEEPEEDAAFEDLVSRMEGESASAGRAKKRRVLAKKAKPGNDSLRAEFADRL